MADTKSSLVKNMTWNTIGNLVYCVCQWVMTILVVKLDSYGGAGYLSLAMSTSNTFYTVASFGMRNYQVSDVKGDYKDSVYLGSRLITNILAIVLCCIYAIGSTSIYQMLCIDAFMFIRIAESIVDVIHGIDQKYDRYDLIGKSYLLRGIATDIAFVAGLLIFQDILYAILIAAVANLVIVFVYDVRKTGQLEKLSLVIKDPSILSLLKKCFPIVITCFLLSMIPLIPKTAIQIMIGNEELGIYSSIASPTLVVQVFATYAFNPLVPKISVLYTEKKYNEFLKVFHKILLIFVAFAVVICIGASLVGRFGLKLLYGADILSSYEFFMPLVWVTIFTAYIWIMNSIVTTIRQIIPMTFAMVIGFGVCYLLSSKFITLFGENGASYIQILCFAIVLAILVCIVEVTIWKRMKCLKDK
jgi:O-antigen/teichoic acid export membrane protein